MYEQHLTRRKKKKKSNEKKANQHCSCGRVADQKDASQNYKRFRGSEETFFANIPENNRIIAPALYFHIAFLTPCPNVWQYNASLNVTN